jgi:hypothetical protein
MKVVASGPVSRWQQEWLLAIPVRPHWFAIRLQQACSAAVSVTVGTKHAIVGTPLTMSASANTATLEMIFNEPSLQLPPLGCNEPYRAMLNVTRGVAVETHRM